MLLLQLNLQAAAGGISVSSATTDAADITAANASPVVSSSSATTNAQDTSAGNVSPVIATSSATTDGQDTTAASVATSISVTSATTDSADITAASVDVVGAGVSVSSATTDAADTTAGSVAIGIGASSATTNAADTTAGQVSTVVSASSTTTNAPDTTATSVAPQLAVSSATTDSADTTAAAIATGAVSAVQSFSNEVVLRKWYVRRGKKLHIFATGEAADAFIEADNKADLVIALAQKTSRLARKRLRNKVISVALPDETVEIDLLAQLIQHFSIPVDLPQLLAQQDWDRVMQIMAIALQAQDDEDIEMLLFAC